MALLLIAFVAGLLTVLAPCTLPLLPVIVGGSISGRSTPFRALTIALSLGLSIFIFTLLLKVSTFLINVPQEFWNVISGGLLFIFGAVTLFPGLWERFTPANTLSLGANRLLGRGYMQGGIFGDIIVGAALGPVFSSCSPTYFIVLATVLPVHPAEGILYLLAYCVGLVLSFLLVSVIGQRIVLALGIAADPTGWFKRAIGGLFIIIGLIILSGWSTQLEADILSHAGIFDVTQIEQQLLLAGSSSSGATSTPMGFLTPAQKATLYPKAPELAGIDGYLNTDGMPITLSQYRGKDVVLVDFWTYSCINCLRTIPYLNAWYQKYKNEGLVIIGVETPEFAFEHLTSNVENAIAQLGIQYPVVQDNEYATWSAFGNEYWPNEYLIDIDGYIVHQQSGEGNYAETEQAIQTALAERAARLGTTTQNLATSTVNLPQDDLNAIQSPETYFGSNRNEFLGNGAQGVSGVQEFSTAQSIEPNTLYLGGSWNITPEYAQNEGAATITYEYDAHNLYIVAAASSPVTIKILRDGKPLGQYSGSDVNPTTSTAVIEADRLYRLIEDPTPGIHTVEIQVMQPGLQAYTFTFG
ncbi:MAG: redoxin domain-containing protein [Patescibacteria group bacterium]|nr:redoxin domain-containing protein [Patescibacteria group bacterium]